MLKNIFSLTNPFNWLEVGSWKVGWRLEVDLQIVLIWRLEFKRLSMNTISVPTENRVEVSSDLLLVNITDLNLSGLRIVLFSKNHFTAASDSNSDKVIN